MSHGLWVIVTCPSRSTNASLWRRIFGVGALGGAGAGALWEISLLSAPFCHEPKTALKSLLRRGVAGVHLKRQDPPEQMF